MTDQRQQNAELLAAIRDLPAAIRDLTAAVRDLTAKIDGKPSPLFSNAPAVARLAAVLLRLSEDNAVVQASQKALAELAGLAEVTVQGLLRDLQRDGIVETGYGSVTIVRRDGLNKIWTGHEGKARDA